MKHSNTCIIIVCEFYSSTSSISDRTLMQQLRHVSIFFLCEFFWKGRGVKIQMRLQKHFDLIVVPLSAINQWKRSPCFSFFRTKQLFFRLLLALIHLMIDEGVSLSIDISISLKTHICRIHQNCIEISKWVNMLWPVDHTLEWPE